MRCSVCGHESPPGSSFCLNCGSALAPVAQTPATPAGLPTICGVCRGENPPGMKFCRACGASLTAAPPPVAAIGAPMPRVNDPNIGALGAPMLAPPPILSAPPQRVAQGSTINCPRCGTATPLGFAYCQQCGLHLSGVVPTDPSQSRARPPTPAVIVNQAVVDPMAGTLAQPENARGVVTPITAKASPRAQAQAQGHPVSPIHVAAPQAAGQWGTAVLVNRDGSDGQRFALVSDDTVVGRAGADIAFDDDRFLARQHARIARTSDGNVTIHPIDTVNGVFKKADAPVELVDGMIILVGREVLRFERVAAEERSAPPLVRHGVALFGSPPRDPWGRLLQLLPSAGHRDVRHLVGEEIVLGREEGDIVFRDDAFMSRRHAALTWDGKRALLTDLGSSNGTFVRLAGPTPLKNGDHVRLGDQLLRIER